MEQARGAAAASMTQDTIFSIGECILDLAHGTLLRAGALVIVRPKTFDLLAHLAINAGRVVSKDELLDVVWPQTTVTEDSLTQCVHDARKAIGDERQSVIRTVPRRGYMFQPSVDKAPSTTARQGVLSVQQAAPDGSVEPMVAVLPFRLPRNDKAAKLLFDGAVEEVTNGLCCFKTIAVLARHSALMLAEVAPKEMHATAERFGIDYLVEGAVDKADLLYNVTVTLSEARSERRISAQTMSFPVEGVFEFQQNVALRIASALVVNIETAAVRRGSTAPTSNVDAYVHMLRGIALLRSYGDGVNQEGRECLVKATRLDPSSGLAHAYLALANVIIAGYGRAPPGELDQARDLALHAILLSPDEARCHRILALVLLYKKDFIAAERHFSRALELNPYDADTLAQMGFLLAKRGRAEEGLKLLDRAIELNPMHPAWYFFDRGEALFCLGRYKEAAQSLASLPRKEAFHLARLAAFHALDGDIAKAATCVAEARAIMGSGEVEAAANLPDIMEILSETAFERQIDFDRLRTGLELAGWDTAAS